MTVDSLSYLVSLEQFGIKFGLDNIRALVERLGHPERSFLSLHIAGTNGKGSVAAMAEAVLGSAGYRTGRYTSPHLVALAERFAINGRPVSDGDLADAAATLQTASDQLLQHGVLKAPPTFFEATTAVAFELFRRARVDVAVCEVGLGGRLDATNVLAPVATAITSIALDHQQYLGNTLAEIAREKAGIIKPGVPVVIGRMTDEARSVIAAIAHDKGAQLFDAAADAPDLRGVEINLRGEHQIDNARVAIRLLESAGTRGLPVDRADVVRGLANVSWPGRLDLRRLSRGREVLLDAAHNPAGASALGTFLRAEGWMRQPFIFAVMGDKEVTPMLQTVLPLASALVVTRTSNARSADPDGLAARARAIHPTVPIVVTPTAAEALSAAWEISDRVVAAGSIFLIGDLLKHIDAA